jgi:hypothetical protein
VENVIRHQHEILEKGRFRALVRVLTMNESLWIGIAFALTLVLNGSMLFWVKESNGKDHDYVTREQLNFLRAFGAAHVVLSAILFLNYCVGTASVRGMIAPPPPSLLATLDLSPRCVVARHGLIFLPFAGDDQPWQQVAREHQGRNHPHAVHWFCGDPVYRRG